MVKNKTRLVILTFSVSFFISFLYINATYALSPDSLLYIFTAQVFLDSGLESALKIYSWPLLSILIAAIHKLTGLPLVASGHILIASLYAGLSYAFVSLTRDLGGSTRTQLLALLVISIFPTLNDFRHYITRDAGFWLFSLLSLQQLLRFVLYHNFKAAVCWLLLILVAISFRTEAFFFAVLAPLAIVIDSHISMRERAKKIATLYGFLACILLVGLLFIAASPQYFEKFRLIIEILNIADFFQDASIEYKQTLASFANIAPNEFSADKMGQIIGTGLIGMVIYTISHALTLPYLMILGGSIKQILCSKLRQKHYLLAYLLIIVFYLLLLSFKKYFMIDRFCTAAALIIMLALPFCIENIWKNTQKFDYRRILIVLLLLYSALDSAINSGSSKQYIAQATQWVRENKTPEQKLLTNQQQIAILGSNCFNSRCLIKNEPNAFTNIAPLDSTLLAVEIKRDELMLMEHLQSLQASANWTLIKTFNNGGNDQVIILLYQPQFQDLP